MGMASMPWDYDPRVGDLYQYSPQETEELPQGPLLKRKEPSTLIAKTRERQLAKSISTIASSLKSAPTNTTKSLLTQVQGLQHLQGAQVKATTHSIEALSQHFAEGSSTGLQSLQTVSFDSVHVRKPLCAANQAFSSELSKRTAGSFGFKEPLVFTSASKLNQCLEAQLSHSSLGDDLKEKGVIARMALSFADKTFSDVKTIQDTMRLELSALHLNRDTQSLTLTGIGMHLSQALIQCGRQVEEPVSAPQEQEIEPPYHW